MKNLIKNELFKSWKQMSIRITVIIILVLIIAVPIFYTTIYSYGFGSSYDSVDYDIEIAEYWIENSTYELETEFYKADLEILKELKEKLPEEWKYAIFGASVRDDYLAYTCFDLIAQGKYSSRDMIDYYNFSLYIRDNAIYKTDDPDEAPDIDEYYYQSIDFDAMDKAANKLAATYKQKYAENLALGQEYTAKDYFESIKTEIYNTADNAEKEYSKLEKDNKTTSAQLKFKRYGVEGYRILKDAMDIIYDKDYKPTGWQHNTLSFISSCAENLFTLSLLSETEFENSFAAEEFGTYEKYVAYMEEQYEPDKEAMRMAYVSIYTNTPMRQFAESPEREGAETSLSFLLSIIMLFGVVIASNTITSEYSSGTIRLLLIRPHSRTKILLSKIIASLIYVLGLSLIATVASFFACGAVGGFSDIFVSDIVYTQSGIYLVPSILRLLKVLGFELLQMLGMIGLTFFIAVLAKKGSISVVVPIIADIIMSGLCTVSLVLAGMFKGMNLLPTAYYDMTIFMPDSVDLLMNYGLTNYVQLELSAVLGVIYHLLFIGGIFAGTIAIYRKHQVKN